MSLEELESEDTDRSVDARGLVLVIKEPAFLMTLFILHKLLGIIKILSDQLKGKALEILRCCSSYTCLYSQDN